MSTENIEREIVKYLREVAAGEPRSSRQIVEGTGLDNNVVDFVLRKLVVDRAIEKQHSPNGHTYSAERLPARRTAVTSIARMAPPSPITAPAVERVAEQLAAPAPSLTDRVWAALHKADRPLMLAELHQEFLPDVHPTKISASLNWLRQRQRVASEGTRGSFQWRAMGATGGPQKLSDANAADMTIAPERPSSAGEPVSVNEQRNLSASASGPRPETETDATEIAQPLAQKLRIELSASTVQPTRRAAQRADAAVVVDQRENTITKHIAAAERDVDELLCDAICERSDHDVLRHLANARSELAVALRLASIGVGKVL